MKVLKFGGTSVGSFENLQKVKKIVENQQERVIIVVSAFSGVTDTILNMAQTASTSHTYPTSELTEIKTRQMTAVQTLIPEIQKEEVIAKIDVLINELKDMIKGISLLGDLTPKTLDRVVGIGERLSSSIIAAYLDAQWLNSAMLIKTDANFGKANVNFFKTNANIKEAVDSDANVMVAPGFIASNEGGELTTLGRGGSDYTAAIYAAATNASAMEIWTDVDGFMTADPRVISKAYTIDYLTYSEAMELSHFGAKVIYPPTILPVLQQKIPVWIKNTTNPEAAGTEIGSEKKAFKGRMIKGISSISNITLITLQGIGMVGVTGISMRLFSALARVKVNVILISQASSENSISIAITGECTSYAEAAIDSEFEEEIKQGRINKALIEKDLSIVAIVGEDMKESPGISGKLFRTLGKNGVNVRAIAQGASELNISWVVKNSDLRKTLNVVHESFFLSQYKEVNLFLMGIGTVGGNLMNQIKQQYDKLKTNNRLKIKLVGIANSKRMLFDRNGIDLDNYMDLLKQSDLKSNINEFVKQMEEMNIFNAIFIDCTANDHIADYYQPILESSISIVAANKVAASSDYFSYKKLKETANKRGVKFYFETNVGAGLPVLSTIKDLVNSGDTIVKIEAVLSGTLNYIFNTLSEDIPLSKAIQMAKEAGYSEPDPRIDLSGKDVMRKLLILAREGGYEMEEDQIKIERFIPVSLFNGSMEQFWDGVKALNERFEDQRKKLEAENKKWRFVATFQPDHSEVSLIEVDSTSPFFDLEGSNNIILLTTERYKEFPMQIKGYGAGAGVTAAGVFSDIMRIANI